MNIGLALGGGAARGWAHIGIITTLADMGITPAMRFYTDNSKVKNEEDSLYLFATITLSPEFVRKAELRSNSKYCLDP